MFERSHLVRKTKMKSWAFLGHTKIPVLCKDTAGAWLYLTALNTAIEYTDIKHTKTFAWKSHHNFVLGLCGLYLSVIMYMLYTADSKLYTWIFCPTHCWFLQCWPIAKTPLLKAPKNSKISLRHWSFNNLPLRVARWQSKHHGDSASPLNISQIIQ